MIKDMTSGSPMRLLIAFSLPLLLGNLFQQFYNMADTIIVGRAIDASALGAVGASGAVVFLIFGFFFGLLSGCTVITAQRFGAGDYVGVRRSVTASILICGVSTVVATLLCVPTTRWLLAEMRTPPELLDRAVEYLEVIYYGIITMNFYTLLACVLRALGDSRTPLWFLIVGTLINIVLDLVFILNFGWGIAGAAWATVISQGVAGGLCLIYVARRFPILHLRAKDWHWRGKLIWAHLVVAVPMAMQFAITAIGVVVLQVGLNEFGATVVTAFAAASRIDLLSVQPMFSVGVAMATFTAQNYGARQMERIRQGVRQGTVLSLACSLLGVVLVFGLGKQLVELFIGANEPEILKAALTYLRIAALFYVVLGLLLVFRNVLQGMGHAVVPMLAGVLELVVRVGGTLFLIDAWGFIGACLISPLAWLGAALWLVAVYFWVMRSIRRNPALVNLADYDCASSKKLKNTGILLDFI